MNKVAAVVVTYNRLEMLKNCLQSLITQSEPCDILIVDNASKDGTEKYIMDNYNQESNIHYKNTGANIGGAGGFNLGMRWAVEMGYDYVWIMDDDCEPRSDALEKFLIADKLLSGNYGWLSSVVLWKNGKECKMNRQKLKKFFFDYVELLQYGLIEALQATFVSLFLKASVIKTVGLPIKEFFIWGDDIEFTRRISVRYNMHCFLVGQSIAIHNMERNNGSSISIDTEEKIDRYKFAFRNENFLYRQERIYGMAYYFAKCGINIWRIIMHAQNKKLYRCYVVVDSMLKGFFFNPRIERLGE